MNRRKSLDFSGFPALHPTIFRRAMRHFPRLRSGHGGGRWVLGHLRVDVVEIIARIPSENLILRVFFVGCLQPPNACFWKCEIPMPLKSLKFRFHREKGWKDEKGWLNQWMWHSNRRIWGSPRTSFQQQGTPLRRPDLKWVNWRDVWRKPSGYLTVALWLFNSLPWKITIFNR